MGSIPDILFNRGEASSEDLGYKRPQDETPEELRESLEAQGIKNPTRETVKLPDINGQAPEPRTIHFGKGGLKRKPQLRGRGAAKTSSREKSSPSPFPVTSENQTTSNNDFASPEVFDSSPDLSPIADNGSTFEGFGGGDSGGGGASSDW